MAKFRPDGTGSDRRGGGSAPISSHRLFPAVVALWFAVLLGLGFAVLPASLLERITSLTGIAAVIPAAAPPLGETARLAISAFAALAGAVLGYAIAKRIGASAPEAIDAAEPRPMRKTGPIAALSELGSASFDTLPHQAETTHETPPYADESADEAIAEEAAEHAWIEHEPEFATGEEFPSQPVEPAAEWLYAEDAEEEHSAPEPEHESESWAVASPEDAWKDFSWGREDDEEQPAEPGDTDPSPQAWPEHPVDRIDAGDWNAPLVPPSAVEQVVAPSQDALERLDQLGLAALTERLGRALQTPRDLPELPPELLARLKAAGVQPGPLQTALSEFPANAEEAAWPSEVHQSDIGLDSFGEEEPVEQAEWDGDWEDDEEGDEDGAASIPSITLGAFQDYAREYNGGDDGEEEEEEAEQAEQAESNALYGSLLGLKISKRSAAAIDFDGSPVPDLEGFAPREIPPEGETGPDTERALRDALDTLKRIGGAG